MDRHKHTQTGPSRCLAGLIAPLLAFLWLSCSDDPNRDPDLETAGDAASIESEPEAADPAKTLSPDAKIETDQLLKEDLAAVPDPSDGGGSARLLRADRLSGEGGLVAGDAARFEIIYEAGPLGIAEGGSLFLQSSPFWGWSTPQDQRPDAPGFTEVSTPAEGVKLEVSGGFDNLLGITIRGRALAAGETVHVVFGAGPSPQGGARVDRYAEHGAEISFGVDGNGDGYRLLIDQAPLVDVGPGPPAQLVVIAPTTVSPGESFTVRVNVLDAVANAGVRATGKLAWQAHGPAPEDLPALSTLAAEQAGQLVLELTAPEQPGTLRLEVTGDDDLAGLHAISNPIIVRADGPRVLWGDLHGHSQLSDGTGTPDDYFNYARQVAGLDISALTDHDHWGLRFLDAHPAIWDSIKDATQRHHAPGEFVTLLGYEWTSWLHGHRHVLYFEDEGEILSSMDPRYQTPAQLWDGLRGKPALTVAHHSAGGPVATNWHFPPDPILEPVTEIVSVHGSSEAADSPGRIYSAVPGNSVRDALNVGYRLGFIGSGDSHDGHPGLAQLASSSGQGGIAGVLSDTRTRVGVLEALRARRTYATNGPRIWLNVTLDGRPMGSTLGPDERQAANQKLRIEVEGTAPISRVDLIRTGRTASIEVSGDTHYELEREIPALAPGEYHYVRVLQSDGGVAWSSPIFAD